MIITCSAITFFITTGLLFYALVSSLLAETKYKRHLERSRSICRELDSTLLVTRRRLRRQEHHLERVRRRASAEVLHRKGGPTL